jgi:hypothetical protein
VRGELVHFTLFDAGSELDLSRIPSLLGRAPAPAPLVTRSAAPPYASFPEPLEVAFDEPGCRVEVRVHQVGVVALRLRILVPETDWAGLAALPHALRIDGKSLEESALAWFGKVRAGLQDARVEPYPVEIEPERYTVYCLSEAPPPDELLRTHRPALAALVAGEPEGSLSDAIVDTALKHTFRYYHNDAAIIGWDNAVLVGREGSYEDALDVMELANLELLEFRTYDAYLDQQLDKAFLSLDRLWARGGIFRSARSTLKGMSALRVDFARLTDNLHDTGKMFGDWYLAKLHGHLRAAFHLDSWERAVAGKMGTLEDMFQLAEEETHHRRSTFLEAMVVALFVLDLILIYILGTT